MQIHKRFFAAAVALVAITACHRERHYICQCQYADSFVTHPIGRVPEKDAYAQCQSFKDSMNSCYMEVRK